MAAVKALECARAGREEEGDEVVPWDDGFQTRLSSAPPRLVRYPRKRQRGFVQVVDQVLAEGVRREILETALAEGGKPWGAYVPLADVARPGVAGAGAPAPAQAGGEGDLKETKKSTRQDRAARCVVEALLVERCPQLHADLFDPAVCDGVAVWCLASGVGAAVEYHLDYAELHRYETNEIAPPLYAATLHVADLEANAADPARRIRGGGFALNTGGLDHYRRCGYKGRLDPAAADLAGPGWLSVPYGANRGIVFDGEWPHAAERVAELPDGKLRVILGLNVFGPRCAAVNRRAPEHSPAFNATVKMYQAAAQSGGLSVAALKQNKGLARILVGLARQRADHDAQADAKGASSSFHVGDKVSARWRTGARWWPATVRRANDDGSFLLHYDDGTKWDAAPASCLRKLPEQPPPPPDRGAA